MNQGRTVFSQLISFLPDREFRRCVERYQGDFRAARPHLLGTVLGHGLCPVDLSRKSARHRSLFGFVAGQAVSPGIPWRGGALDPGRCQRVAGLANLRRLRPAADRDRAQIVYARAHGRRSGREPVRSGFDDHRSVSGTVSLGPVPAAQGGRQDAHAAGPARQYSNLHSHYRWQGARCQLARRDHAGSRSLLCNGSRLHRFPTLVRADAQLSLLVVRTKSNVLLQRRYSHAVDKSTGVRSDQTVILSSFESACAYPDALRRVSYFDAETNKRLKFLTNNFTLPPLTIAQIYKQRWQVELFFKWIKQHLRIKAFYGTSENAVKTQIWIAVSVYVLVAIVRKRLGLEASLYQILQILSLTLFEKTPILCALRPIDQDASSTENVNQLILFEF